MVDLGLYWSHCCWLSYGCHSHLCPLPDLSILFSRPSTVAMSASSVFQDLECRCLSLAIFTIPDEFGYLASAIHNHSMILLFLIVSPPICL